MNDLIPMAIFVGCLLATLGLVRVCEWLRPASSPQHSVLGAASVPTPRREEAAR